MPLTAETDRAIPDLPAVKWDTRCTVFLLKPSRCSTVR